MNIKLNLRKLSAINTEIQGVIRSNKRQASEASKVTLRAFQTVPYQQTIDEGKEALVVLFEQSTMLQNVLSRFRAVVATKNNEFGITATLQELREVEDRLSLVSDFVVTKTKNPDYDGFSVYEDAIALVSAYAVANAASDSVMSASRRVGAREAHVRFVSDQSLTDEVKALQRKVKEIKNDRLVALNYKDVSVEISAEEKELLESLNIL